MFVAVLEAADPIPTDILEHGDPKIEAEGKIYAWKISAQTPVVTIKSFIVKHFQFSNCSCCSFIPAYLILLLKMWPRTYAAMEAGHLLHKPSLVTNKLL
jgi:hypothetical protein